MNSKISKSRRSVKTIRAVIAVRAVKTVRAVIAVRAVNQ
jgi:hypothetical protein